MTEIADICILVEGTYPYVSGGVSSWIHGLITNLPEFTFSLVHLSSARVADRVMQYTLPANVIGVHDLFLQDFDALPPGPSGRRCPEAWRAIGDLHEALGEGRACDHAAVFHHLADRAATGPTTADLIFSRESWDLLVARYEACSPETPFVDFFWTFRATPAPLFRLLEASLPPARIYHTPSTGFGGLLGALGKMRTGAPFLVTEHGIYTHEREIEIAHADWIPEPIQADHRLDTEEGFFRTWWNNMFGFMTRVSYDLADEIISITQSNQRYQLNDGADPAKMTVIPNGIDIARFRAVRPSLERQTDRFSAGFIGRVVPIKDVKTFIRAINIVRNVIPDVTAPIVGPTEEDPEYFAECEQLVELLGLEGVVRFTGRADVREYYRDLDVVVLTSLSEAQPLVVLEANCVGVPVVTTDVGACWELVGGITPEDRAIGPSGLLTAVASPQETAEAIIRLWRDEPLRRRMAAAGQERVAAFYQQEQLYATYRTMYRHYLGQTPIVPDHTEESLNGGYRVPAA
jgi:glycosyltransferase involved in cell wall biosynthesis